VASFPKQIHLEAFMKFSILAVTLALALSANPSRAHDHEKSGDGAHTEMKAEMRKEMADAHEKMAACLRSDKSMQDCHKEMNETREKMHSKMKEMHKGKKGHKHEGGESEKE
jgi:hypothetical protein